MTSTSSSSSSFFVGDEFCTDRFERGIKQNIYVIDIDTRNQNDKVNPHILFFVCGTTRNTYSVTFTKKKVVCTCMDFKLRQQLCKHIYFLIGKVGRLSLEQIQTMFGDLSAPKSAFLKTTFFTRKSHQQKKLSIILQKIVEIIEKNVEEMKKGDGENDCCICLETLEKNDRCIDCQQCKKLFHSSCIGFWLNNKKKCPLCRTGINTKSDRIIV